MATARTARDVLERISRVRPARLPRRRPDGRRVVVADIDGGGGRGGLLGASGADTLAPGGPVPVAGAPTVIGGAGDGGLLTTAPPSPGALASGLQLAGTLSKVPGLVSKGAELLGLTGGGTLAEVGAGGVGFTPSTAAGAFPFAPAAVSAPGITGTTAGIVAPGAGFGITGGGAAAPAAAAAAPLAGTSLAAAAPVLGFGLPAAAAALYSKTVGPSKARGSFKVDNTGKITHRNIKDSGITEKAAFNAFADWVGENVKASGAKVPDPGDVSFGVRGREVYLQPAGGGDRQFFDDPRELLSALTAMGGKRRDFSDVEVPDFSEAGRQAAAAEAERLTGMVDPTAGGPLAGDIFEPTGMIGRLRQSAANTRGLIDQPEFRDTPIAPAGGLLANGAVGFPVSGSPIDPSQSALGGPVGGVLGAGAPTEEDLLIQRLFGQPSDLARTMAGGM